ncbi:FAD-dependent oxidoreductase [Paenibacillus sp. RC67]|uniref:FAD-dependent oxidoreductase n=1 Tax=Paenibacillus sp. RC67 TaxID=3039392 RepID=UPI0024AE51F6|nr:FAD-dependent oxidoreductase [Paenibacillus sp. RC67]
MKWNGKRLSVSLSVLALVAAGAVYSVMHFGGGGAQQNPGASATAESGNKPQAIAPTPTPEPPIPSEKVDVVVLGSELEGMYLARAAADEGLKVKVLDPREAFGGQVLQGEMLFLDETRDDQYHSLVQGRAKELFDGFRNAKIRKLPEFTQYFDKLKKDIPVESGIKIQDVKQIPGKFGPHAIESITYAGKDGAKKNIKADYFVDNTDYAALLSKLDATRMPGLEAFYGQNNIEYMSSGMMMKFKNVDWNKFKTSFNNMTPEQRKAKYGGGSVDDSFAIGLSGMTNAYKPSNDRVFLRGLNAVNQRDGEVIINAFLIYTVDPSNDKSIADAMELGKKEIPLILNHFRKNIVGWENAELNGFPNYLYIREYNHYESDYVLKPSDMLGAKMFWDNVSIAGYPLDLQGTSANKWGIEMGRPDKYGMPLRSFLLKNYDNVIMAGKNVGASAIAFGSARIQPNTSTAAETIGILMGQLNGKKKLRELTEADMPELDSYLETKYKIKLTGVKGNNKIAGWTNDEIAKLDTGEIVYASYVNKRKK